MTMTPHEYMWENLYKPRAAALPADRKMETVALFKTLILEMYASGYTPHRISKLLGKDHTTIYYHIGATASNKPPKNSIKISGLSARLEHMKAKRAKRLEALEIHKQIKKEKAAMKEVIRLEKIEEANQAEEFHKKVASQREEAMAFYKKGMPVRRIAIELGVADSRVQTLIQVHPDYRKHPRKSTPHRHRGVLQHDMQGNLLATHKTTREAAQSVKGNNPGISLAARGIIQTYKGYVWRYGQTVDPLKFKL